MRSRVRRRVFAALLLSSGVLVLGSSVAIAAGITVYGNERTDAAHQADRRMALAQTSVMAEVRRYEDMLSTVAAGLGGYDHLTPQEYAAVTVPMAGAKLPGATGVTFVVPAADGDVAAVQAYWRRMGASGLTLQPFGGAQEHLFSIYSRPLDGQPPRATGGDVAQSPEAIRATTAARRAGDLAVSNTYLLLRDRNLPAAQRQLSFVLAAPVYGLATPDGARPFRGWVMMGLHGQDFVGATLGDVSQHQVDASLWAVNADGEPVEVAALRAGRRADLHRRVTIAVAQQQWTLRLDAAATALPGVGTSTPFTDAGAGIAVSLLLAWIVYVLSTGRARAELRVQEATVDLRAAEREARRQAGLLAAVMNSISDGVGVVDEHGNFLLHNPAAKDLLGLSEDVDGPQNWQEHYGIFRPDGMTPFPAAELPLVRALSGDATDGVEMIVRNGSRPAGVWLSVSGRPLDPSAGQRGAVAVFHDITARKQIETERAEVAERMQADLLWRKQVEAELRAARDELALQKAYLDQVLDAIDVAVVTCDASGVMQHSNRAAREWSRLRGPAATVDEVAVQFNVTGQSDDAGLPLLRSLHGEEVHGAEMTLTPPGGRRRELLVHSHPLRDGDGRIIGAVSSAYDVTVLHEREAEVRAFAAVAAHDLKAPLATIAGYVELVADALAAQPGGPATRQAERALERVTSGVGRMRRLIDDLLAFATAQQATLDLRVVDLGALFTEVLAEHTDHLRGGQDTYPDVYAGHLPRVVADPGMLRQVVTNLVGNALKYVPPGRRPRLDVSAEEIGDGRVRVVVADRGIGIADDQKPRVFDSFHRAHSGQGYTGTGLGLAICQRIVARHGGTIGVEDNPGGGSRFHFTLDLAVDVALGAVPVPEAAASGPPAPDATQPAPAAAPARAGGRHLRRSGPLP
jgi:signal transduction histidine kinase